jgi:hypothetical protein
MSSRITRQEPLARTLIALCPDPGRILVSDVKEAFKQSEVSLEEVLKRLEVFESSLSAVHQRVELLDRVIGDMGEAAQTLENEVHEMPRPPTPLSAHEVADMVYGKIDMPGLVSRIEALKVRVSAQEIALERGEREGCALRGELGQLKTMQRQTFDLVQKNGEMHCLDTLTHVRSTLAVHSSEACTLTFENASGLLVQRPVVRGMQLVALDAGTYTLTSTVPASEALQLTLF